jgi:hypothetical protein
VKSDAVKRREDALRGAIEGAYKVFRHYPRPKHLFGYAPVPVPGEGMALRYVDEKWCGWYSSRAVTTQGTVNDLKHFLPRLLEVGLVDWLGDGDWRSGREVSMFNWELVDLPTLATRLVYAGFHEWPDAEKEAVRGVVRMGWNVRMVVGDEWGRAFERMTFFDDWAVSFYCLFSDLSWVVAAWTEAVKVPELRGRALMYLTHALMEESDRLSAFVKESEVTASQRAELARLFGNGVLLRFLKEMEEKAEDDWMKLQLMLGEERARGYREVWRGYRGGDSR